MEINLITALTELGNPYILSAVILYFFWLLRQDQVVLNNENRALREKYEAIQEYRIQEAKELLKYVKQMEELIEALEALNCTGRESCTRK